LGSNAVDYSRDGRLVIVEDLTLKASAKVLNGGIQDSLILEMEF